MRNLDKTFTSDYLKNLDPDLKKALLQQIHVYWTHHSTSIEGNTLTLGETHHVLMEGLTISGKSLKDHNEVYGHEKSICILENLIQRTGQINEQDVFQIHQAIQTHQVADIYKPVGKWKREENVTTITLEEKQVINDTYATPEDVPSLMKDWFKLLNSELEKTEINPIQSFTLVHSSFVGVHPFFDGNGRIARLLANLALLKKGLPPLIIPKEKRLEYIQLLGEWQLKIGKVQQGKPLVIYNSEYEQLERFFEGCWESISELIEEVYRIQRKRV